MNTITINDAMRISMEKGKKWFTPSAMEAFGSRIETDMLEGNYFVSSEQDTKGVIGPDGKRYKAWNGKRRFTTHRFIVESGSVVDISEFGEFASLKSALKSLEKINPKVDVGDQLVILYMNDEHGYAYEGRVGRVTDIDSIGQIHGTWGSLALIPETDIYELKA